MPSSTAIILSISSNSIQIGLSPSLSPLFVLPIPPALKHSYHSYTLLSPSSSSNPPPTLSNPLLPLLVSLTLRLNVADLQLPFYLHCDCFNPSREFREYVNEGVKELYHHPTTSSPLVSWRFGPTVSLISLGVRYGCAISIGSTETYVECLSNNYPIQGSRQTLPLNLSNLRSMISDVDHNMNLTKDLDSISFVLDTFTLTIFNSAKFTHNSDYNKDQNLVSAVIRSILACGIDDRICVAENIVFGGCDEVEWLDLFEERLIKEEFERVLKEKYDEEVGGISKVVFEVKDGSKRGEREFCGLSVVAGVDAAISEATTSTRSSLIS